MARELYSFLHQSKVMQIVAANKTGGHHTLTLEAFPCRDRTQLLAANLEKSKISKPQILAIPAGWKLILPEVQIGS
jgi:hypothetical protein